MADPRSTVNYEGIDFQAETFDIDNSTITYDATKANGSAQVGLAVTFSGNHQVALAVDASLIVGKLIGVESDNRATVQTDGYCTLPGGNGQTLTAGSRVVGALGASSAKGYIRNAAATAAEALAAGESLVIDGSVGTAVVVNL